MCSSSLTVRRRVSILRPLRRRTAHNHVLRIISTDCYASQCAFGRIVVDLDAAIVTVACQGLPTTQHVANRFGCGRFLRECCERLFEPRLHGIEQWTAAFLAHSAALVGNATANLLLDNVERTDPGDHLSCHRRFVQFIQLDELAPSVRPAPDDRHVGHFVVAGKAVGV